MFNYLYSSPPVGARINNTEESVFWSNLSSINSRSLVNPIPSVAEIYTVFESISDGMLYLNKNNDKIS